MAPLRNRRKLVAVSTETTENGRNNQSQNTLNPVMGEEFFTQVCGESEGRVTKKPEQDFSRK